MLGITREILTLNGRKCVPLITTCRNLKLIRLSCFYTTNKEYTFMYSTSAFKLSLKQMNNIHFHPGSQQ